MPASSQSSSGLALRTADGGRTADRYIAADTTLSLGGAYLPSRLSMTNGARRHPPHATTPRSSNEASRAARSTSVCGVELRVRTAQPRQIRLQNRQARSRGPRRAGHPERGAGCRQKIALGAASRDHPAGLERTSCAQAAFRLALLDRERTLRQSVVRAPQMTRSPIPAAPTPIEICTRQCLRQAIWAMMTHWRESMLSRASSSWTFAARSRAFQWRR